MKKPKLSESNISTFEAIQFVVPKHQSLCLYLSSGISHLHHIAKLDHDFFIFNDSLKLYGDIFIRREAGKSSIDSEKIWDHLVKSFACDKHAIELVKINDEYIHFKYQQKHIAFFFDDNNILVNRLKNTNLVIDTLIGINDGCNEGGNYECINQTPFLLNLLPILNQNLNYIIDHSYTLEKTEYARGCSTHPKFKNELTITFKDLEDEYAFENKRNIHKSHHGSTKINNIYHVDNIERRVNNDENNRQQFLGLNFQLQAVLVYIDEDLAVSQSQNKDKKSDSLAGNATLQPSTKKRLKLTVFAFKETDISILEKLKPLREEDRTSRLAYYKVNKIFDKVQ